MSPRRPQQTRRTSKRVVEGVINKPTVRYFAITHSRHSGQSSTSQSQGWTYSIPFMHNVIVPPPTMDSFAPEFCFCGKKTVQYHEFWFCSTHCARLDSLRSLDDPECHYRNVVRKAYVRAGVPELYPRRMMSADQLRPGPSEQHSFANAPSRFPPPTNPSHQRNVAGFSTLSQVTGKVLTKNPTAGEPLFTERHDRPRREGFPNAPSRAHPVQRPRDHAFQQISLDAIPLPEHVPTRSLRHVPQSSDCLRNNIRKSVAALLNVGRSRKDKEDENPRVFGHPMNSVIPPMRKESLPSHHQMSPPSAIPVQSSRALRRSASFAGWDMTPHCGPSNEQDVLLHIIEEIREECSESFDPRSLFIWEEPY